MTFCRELRAAEAPVVSTGASLFQFSLTAPPPTPGPCVLQPVMRRRRSIRRAQALRHDARSARPAIDSARGDGAVSSGDAIPRYAGGRIDDSGRKFRFAHKSTTALGLKPGGRAAEDVAVKIVDIAATGVFDVKSLTTAVLTRREA